MSKFTKGEWEYLEAIYQVTAFPASDSDWEQEKWNCSPDADSVWWQDITGELCGSDEEEIHANGRLIASAPEMYKLLKAFAECRHEDGMFGLMEDAQELIARIDVEEVKHERRTQTMPKVRRN